MRSGPSNGSRISELQLAIGFRIDYQDNFHTTHSKLHEVTPPLYITAAASCRFIYLCAADHCKCYPVKICSANSPSCRTSYSLCLHHPVCLPTVPIYEFHARACHPSQWLLMLKFNRAIYFGQFTQFTFTFPTLRGICHMHPGQTYGQSRKQQTEDTLLAIQTQTEPLERYVSRKVRSYMIRSSHLE
jgi:hypothetical protein